MSKASEASSAALAKAGRNIYNFMSGSVVTRRRVSEEREEREEREGNRDIYILSNPPFYEKNGEQVQYKTKIRGYPYQEIRQQPDGTYVLVSLSARNSASCMLTPLREVFRTPEEAAALSNKTAVGMLEIPGMLEIMKEYNCNAGTRIGGGRRHLRSRRRRTNRRNTRRYR